MEQEKQIHTEVVDIDDLIQDDHNGGNQQGGGSQDTGTEAGAVGLRMYDVRGKMLVFPLRFIKNWRIREWNLFIET